MRNILVKLVAGLLICAPGLRAQDLLYSDANVGFNIGINLSFGTHFQRAGVNLNFFYVNDHFQANSELRAYLSFRNLGPRFVYPELLLSQGVVYAYGAKRNFFNPFINSVSNQSSYSNAAAYSYNAYFNKRKTTQQTGTIALEFGSMSILIENDILGHNYYDRFRTGGFLVQYQYKDQFQAGLNCTLWTGKMGRTVSDTSSSRWPCYMDTVRGLYTQYSHGLLSAQIKYNAGYSQNVQLNAGVDAEQVRDVVQNKFIHDLAFLPRKWAKPKNCHMPMLNSEGGQYLYQPGQKIRPPRLYLNLFSNAGVFY